MTYLSISIRFETYPVTATNSSNRHLQCCRQCLNEVGAYKRNLPKEDFVKWSTELAAVAILNPLRVVRETEDNSIYDALPLVKINKPYRKAYSIGCRSKNYVTNAGDTRNNRPGISVNHLIREIE